MVDLPRWAAQRYGDVVAENDGAIVFSSGVSFRTSDVKLWRDGRYCNAKVAHRLAMEQQRRQQLSVIDAAHEAGLRSQKQREQNNRSVRWVHGRIAYVKFKRDAGVSWEQIANVVGSTVASLKNRYRYIQRIWAYFPRDYWVRCLNVYNRDR